LNRIGSAINELGAAGSATGQNVAEFANRIGGATGFSIQQTLGLGAALQELGITSELASSGVKVSLRQMNVESVAFAKALGMSSKEYEEMYNTDLMGLLRRVAGLFGGKSNFEVGALARNLKLNDQESQRVLKALANDTTGILQKSLDISSQHFAKATSLAQEFRTKNENFPAILDKMKNGFLKLGLTMGEAFAPLAIIVAKAFTKLADVLQRFASSPVGAFVMNLTIGLGALLLVAGVGLIVMGGFKYTVLKLAMAFAEQTRATILSTIAQKGYIAGLRQMAVATWQAFGPYIILAATLAAFVGILYIMYKAIEKEIM
jgi:TP901 family phage tail tape measure protein